MESWDRLYGDVGNVKAAVPKKAHPKMRRDRRRALSVELFGKMFGLRRLVGMEKTHTHSRK